MKLLPGTVRDAVVNHVVQAQAPIEHRMLSFEECSLFNSEHAYRDGYSRAVCACGWKSVLMRKEEALVLAYGLHARGEAI